MEQSKRLIELGLDQATADMCWVGTFPDTKKLNKLVVRPQNRDGYVEGEACPAWSVQALYDVMPEFINGDRIEVELSKVYNWSPEQDLVYIGCIRNERTMDGVFYSYGETAIDAIVGLAFKLLEADQQ